MFRKGSSLYSLVKINSCNFRDVEVGWLRLCLHQHFGCRQKCGFEVNPLIIVSYCALVCFAEQWVEAGFSVG